MARQSDPDIFLLRAPFVVLDPDRVIADGAVAVRGGRVVASGPVRSLARRFGLVPRDAGDVVLAPGLVNAHTHLELSALRGRLQASADFTGWVRSQLEALSRWTRRDFIRSYRLGLRLALGAGTTAIGDVCRRPFLVREALRSPLRTVHHFEVIEPDPRRWRDALLGVSAPLRIRSRALPRSRAPTLFHAALSPHAPWTVSPRLYRALFRLASARRVSLQTHLAETRDEVGFVKTGEGALRDFLENAGRPMPFEKPPACTPVRYLDRLGVLRPPLAVVHGNYLTRDDIDTLARRRVSVVFCPRSHAFFRHAPHPIRALLRAGVPVALGTDSLASNRDLDLRAEMREAVERYGLRAAEAWRMATAAGGRALQGGAGAGTLQAGAPADMAAFVRPAGARARGLLDRLLDPGTRIVGTWVAGRPVARGTA